MSVAAAEKPIRPMEKKIPSMWMAMFDHEARHRSSVSS
jgi:hypothetical protein